MRQHWRSLALVTLLVAVAGAMVFTASAGARRTATVLERFREYSRSADIQLDLRQASAGQLDALRRVPGVAGVGVLHQMNLDFPNGELAPLAAAIDKSFGTEVDRPRVVSGRLPRPASVRDLAIGESLASSLRVGVGDEISFVSYTPAQTELGATGASPGPPQGPKVRFRVVGVVRRPLDLGVRGSFGGFVVPTPAFYERYRDEIGSFVGAVARVHTEHGTADLRTVVPAARRIFGDSLFQVESVTVETDGARDAIGVLTAALWIFAAVAALAGSTAVGMVVVRQVGNARRDQEILATVGCTTLQRAAAAVAVILPAGVVGGVLAVAAAALMSPVLPFGIARKAEVDPGFHFDGLVLGAGLVVVVAFVLLVAAVAAWRVARAVAGGHAVGGVTRPSSTARVAASAGASPALTTGLRMALEPGRGPTAVPVRSAFLGATLGTLGIVAVLVIGASLDHLVATPRLYGWPWDAVVQPNLPFRQGPSNVCGDGDSNVTADPRVAAVASACLETIEVDGHPLTGWGFTSLKGSVEPTIVRGRAPRGRDEVALGADALDATGKRIGDTVRVRGDRTRTYHIVGQVVIPTLTYDDPEPLADGAAFTGVGLQAVFEPISAPNMDIVARFGTGVEPDRLPRTRDGRVQLQSGIATLANVPVEIDRLRQVDHLPLILGTLLALLATVAVAHAVVVAVRRRRRDLAVLRTLGFERGDVRATIAYQATALVVVGLFVGVPVGIVVGRLVWRALAGSLGVQAVVTVPSVPVIVVAVAALAVVNVIGVLAAAAAVRDSPATVLAAE